MGIGAAFLLFILIFGRSIAAQNFDVLIGCAFAVLGLAAVSFLAFCFLPYFHGDRRWFAIPSLLTVVFFVGAASLPVLRKNGIISFRVLLTSLPGRSILE